MNTEKYTKNYIPGFDCRLTTFRNNLAYYDLNITNSMALGLSSCFNFHYSPSYENMLGLIFINGITNQSIESLSTIFSTHLFQKKCTYKNYDYIKEVKEVLEMGCIANILINREMLKHIRTKSPQEFAPNNSYNIGHHYISIVGVDNGGNFIAMETDSSKPFKLQSEELEKIWFFDNLYSRNIVDSFLKCDGYYYYFMKPKINAHKDKVSIIFAINNVIQVFLQNELENWGMIGMQKFFNDLERDIEALSNIEKSIWMFKVNEFYLSGGGLGRRLYGNFLSEASIIFKSDELSKIASMFMTTGKYWTQFIKDIASLAKRDKKIIQSDFSPVITRYKTLILSNEKNQMNLLYEWLKSKHL